MPKTINKCLIIIATYNAVLFLDKLLSPLRNLPKGIDVLVIDNNSCDETVLKINQSYAFVKIIRTQKNLGFGAANNIGLSYALKQGYEHVLLLNQDAYITKQAIKQLIVSQEQNPEFYILSPVHYSAQFKHLDQGFIEYVKSSNDFIEDALKGSLKTKPYCIRFVNAAIWLLSQQCIKEIGGFNPVFYHYAEDDNYIDRVIYHKHKVGIVANARAIHDRYDRAPSPFDEKYTVKYRTICLVLSNPNLRFGKYFKRNLVALIKNIYKIQNLKVLLKIIYHIRNIYRNRIISMGTKKAFLE